MQDNRIVTIEEAGFGLIRANNNLVYVEDKGTFYKAVSMAFKDVSACAYSVDEAVMECVRKIRIHSASAKYSKINKKLHA